jgi:acetolactate synthase-1/2/3 large subunit
MKVSDYIWQYLYKITGSKHVFLLSGGGMMHLLDSVGKSKFKSISMHHEQAASIAANAYGRTINSIGACLVTSGPGATNALTGVTAAFMDSVPMVIISGQVSTLFSKKKMKIRQLGFQEFDIISSVKPTTKYAVHLNNKYKVQYELEKACYLAKNGRPGPVWLDIPLDIQNSDIKIQKNKSFFYKNLKLLNSNPNPKDKEINLVIKNLKKSKRPLIVFGHGTYLSGAKNHARKFISNFKLPCQTTWNSIDLIPDKNKYYFGRANSYGPRYPNFIIQNADYILSIGARLGVQHTGYNVKAFARNAVLHMVDLDINEAKKPKLKVDKFIKSDAKRFIEKLSNKLKKHKFKEDLSSWINYCNNIKRKFPVAPLIENIKNQKYVDPYYFVDKLSDELRDDELVPLGSSGSCFTVSGQTFKSKKNQRVFTAKGMASMGFGLPSTIGSSLSMNNKRSITIIGDGGFQLNVQELQTIITNKLKVKIFVFQNKGYHAIRVTPDTYFQKNYVGSSEINGVEIPNIKKVANAYGLKYSYIANNKELRNKLKKILNNDIAEIIEVKIDPNKHLYPKLTSQIGPDGKMSTSPLEDLYPFISRDELKKIMISE